MLASGGRGGCVDTVFGGGPVEETIVAMPVLLC